jgi:pilus assembly protein CpaC
MSPFEKQAGDTRRGVWLSLFLFGLAAVAPGLIATVRAQETIPTPPPAKNASSALQTLHVIAGRSMLITSPVAIKRVSLADPNIADALIVSPYQILLNGKQPGATSLLIWDDKDQSQAFDVYVDLDILALQQKIREVFPNEQVDIEASKDTVMLSGKVSSKEIADKIYAIVSAVTPKVISLMQAPPVPPVRPKEILLEVRFAEVDLSALEQLGTNIFMLPSASNKTMATSSTGQFSPPSATPPIVGQPTTGTVSLGQALNLFLYRTDLNLGVMIEALKQKNVLQILAEPNLLAESGTDATFLAGGQFPYPVVQGGVAGAVPTVTITFKDYGIRLNFHPDVLADGEIHLKVAPEVSTLDYSNAVTISGFVLPAISIRRVESEMLLADGQSFTIAGLEDHRLTDTISKVPGIGDIPVLGNLFRSKQLNKTRSELFVVVTPHIVQPTAAGAPMPGVSFPQSFLPLVPPSASPPAKPPKGPGSN